MIEVIGKENCSACEMTKTILKNKNIEFTYILFEELAKEDRDNCLNMAREQGKMSMPLIIENYKLKTLQEVIA